MNLLSYKIPPRFLYHMLTRIMLLSMFLYVVKTSKNGESAMTTIECPPGHFLSKFGSAFDGTERYYRFGCSKFAGYITNTQQLFDEHCDTTHFESSLTDEDSDLYLSCGSDQYSVGVQIIDEGREAIPHSPTDSWRILCCRSRMIQVRLDDCIETKFINDYRRASSFSSSAQIIRRWQAITENSDRRWWLQICPVDFVPDITAQNKMSTLPIDSEIRTRRQVPYDWNFGRRRFGGAAMAPTSTLDIVDLNTAEKDSPNESSNVEKTIKKSAKRHFPIPQKQHHFQTVVRAHGSKRLNSYTANQTILDRRNGSSEPTGKISGGHKHGYYEAAPNNGNFIGPIVIPANTPSESVNSIITVAERQTSTKIVVAEKEEFEDNETDQSDEEKRTTAILNIDDYQIENGNANKKKSVTDVGNIDIKTTTTVSFQQQPVRTSKSGVLRHVDGGRMLTEPGGRFLRSRLITTSPKTSSSTLIAFASVEKTVDANSNERTIEVHAKDGSLNKSIPTNVGGVVGTERGPSLIISPRVFTTFDPQQLKFSSQNGNISQNPPSVSSSQQFLAAKEYIPSVQTNSNSEQISPQQPQQQSAVIYNNDNGSGLSTTEKPTDALDYYDTYDEHFDKRQHLEGGFLKGVSEFIQNLEDGLTLAQVAFPSKKSMSTKNTKAKNNDNNFAVDIDDKSFGVPLPSNFKMRLHFDQPAGLQPSEKRSETRGEPFNGSNNVPRLLFANDEPLTTVNAADLDDNALTIGSFVQQYDKKFGPRPKPPLTKPIKTDPQKSEPTTIESMLQLIGLCNNGAHQDL